VLGNDIWYRLRALFHRDAMERELDAELQFHLEEAAAAHVRDGRSPDEARRLARLELGGVAQVKEDSRDARGVRFIHDFFADLRFGLRMMWKAPAFAAIAILTLALGIGANTAMFAIVDDVLLHAVPYDDAGQLVRLHASKPSFDRGSISYPNFRDWQAANHSFSEIAVLRAESFTLSGAGEPERVSAALISEDWFKVLRVAPLIGHTFKTEPNVALLGEAIWKRKFAAARDVVGKTIVLDNVAYAVVGVVPQSTDLNAVAGGKAIDIYVPITQLDKELQEARGAGLGIHGIARLKPGVTLAQARADMAAVTSHLADQYPETNRSIGATIDPLAESVVGNLRPYLLVLLAAVGIVLLIACVNVANLLLARSAKRSHELAIRVAVGASFGRLIRQLLTESLLLAMAAGAFGLLLAWWSTDALLALMPGRLSRVHVDSFDPRILLFTAGVSLAAGVLAGLVPALKAIAPNVYSTLKEGGRGASSRSRPQAVFVVLQTAMTVVLLIGAGLLVRTMLRLASISPGYDPENVVTFGLSLSPQLQAAPPATVRAKLVELETAIATSPGVESASFSFGPLPIEGGDQSLFWVDGRPKPETQDQMNWTVASIVGPDFVTTMRIPLRRGRFFTARDDEHAPGVVVIDEAFAELHFPHEDPVGKRIHLAFMNFDTLEIVGVVGHVKMGGLDQDDTATVRPELYMALRQFSDDMVGREATSLVVQARLAQPSGLGAIRRTVAQHGADNVMFRVRTVDEVIASYQATRRFAMFVLVAFGGLALVLCCVGIYGVISYVVARRTTELGVRMALGATASIIVRLILRDGLKLALAGVAIGLVVACLVTRFMTGILYGVAPIDPLTFAVVAVGVTIVASLALLIPARRATRLDVTTALRAE
jgi:predicted permease